MFGVESHCSLVGLYVVTVTLYDILFVYWVSQLFCNSQICSFKEKDVVRHSLVRRLLKRYKPSFNIIDDVSAEKTISMWIHDEGLDSAEDGSMDNDYYYKLKK